MASVSVTSSIDVDASPEQVWAEISDPTTWSAWNTNHVGFSGDAPALAPAAEFTEQLQVRGAAAEVDWTVDALEQPQRLALSGKGPLSIKLEHRYAIAPAGDGSRVEITLSLSALALKPMVKALSKELEKNLPTSLEALRDRLASDPG